MGGKRFFSVIDNCASLVYNVLNVKRIKVVKEGIEHHGRKETHFNLCRTETV